jgi:HEPN domain-containing protein
LQQFAEERIRDAEILLKAGQWQGAYYLSGYAVELGLKSCVLAYIEKTGMIFKDRKYLQELPKCWTHSLEELLGLAGLKVKRDADAGANADLFASWGTVGLWTESSRYEQKTKDQAQAIYNAITHPEYGVLQWIRQNW